jgi:hypothetical protein
MRPHLANMVDGSMSILIFSPSLPDSEHNMRRGTIMMQDPSVRIFSPNLLDSEDVMSRGTVMMPDPSVRVNFRSSPINSLL